ncbi:MAG: prepilin-type N-terminal cleavage/methylation domain-containing protein [Verrucomicrobium sp.]|nr:prepilin-type N-terminal cleavage/methylation domain-containing protein [Verrucomicrobium sp.]
MKTLPLSSRRSFTLVELLVVMGLIGILAAMTLGAADYLDTKGKSTRAQGEIAAFEAALERYKNDNGTYPPTDPIASSDNHYVTNQTSYLPNARALYQSLSGVTNDATNSPPAGPVYFEFKASQIRTAPRPFYAADPWGEPYGFATAAAPNGGTNNLLYNIGFCDIWSAAGQTRKGAKLDTNSWINNWSRR